MNCDKFEELFVKETEDELLEHIQVCETCRLEYKKMQVTEKIIKEAKPHFAAKKHTQKFANIAACFALVVVSSTVAFQNNFYGNLGTKISYEESVSGEVPVDEYGLLDIQ